MLDTAPLRRTLPGLPARTARKGTLVREGAISALFRRDIAELGTIEPRGAEA